MDADEIWTTIQKRLRKDEVIRNWTAAKGYLGDSFTVGRVAHDVIEIVSPNAVNVQKVREQDFRTVFGVWQDYRSGKVQRQELREGTRVSKYVISILNHLSL